MTKIVKKTSMGNYELKGIYITGKPHVYIGTSGYPTCHYRGMDLPCGKMEKGYGVGENWKGADGGAYEHIDGEVIILRQPRFPIQWSAWDRFQSFKGGYYGRGYESYAKEADKWRKEHGLKEETVEVPQHVKDTLGLMRGSHDVVYDGEVKELTRPIRAPSKKGVVVVKTGKITEEGKKFIESGAASVRALPKKTIAIIVGFFVVLAVLVGRKI